MVAINYKRKRGVVVRKSAIRVKATPTKMVTKRRSAPRRKYVKRTTPKYVKKTFNSTQPNTSSKSITIGSRKATVSAMLSSIMEPQWYRCQGMTEYGLTRGFYALRNATTNAGDYVFPAHVWDLTAIINLNSPATGNTQPNVGFALYNTVAGDSYAYTLASIDSAGTVLGNTNLQFENTSTVSRAYDDPFRKAWHEYTNLKMNLYGVAGRSTRYLVQVVQFKDGTVDPITGAGTNVEKKKLFDYLVRPFMYNNLNVPDPKGKQYVKVLNSYEITLDRPEGLSTTESQPNIHTLNMFINHNRVRRYDWLGLSTPLEPGGPGWDQENGVGYETRVDPDYRIYLLIRAFNSVEELLQGDLQQTVQSYATATTPSYDLVLRQKFQTPL